MTIDEAIRHCEEVAEQNETSAITYKNCKEIKTNMYEKLTAEKAESDCLQCATDHRQLAEWLTELKEAKRLLKAAVEDFTKVPCNNDAYNPNSCGICVKQNNCNYSDSFKWRYTDEALALFGEDGEENG